MLLLDLELWYEIIECYKSLGKNEKAEELIRKELTKKETPELWCALGDVTNNPEYYEKSWEMSNQHFARAQRCLAQYHLARNNVTPPLQHVEN